MFNKTWYKSPLGKGNSKLLKLIKGPVFFKGKMIKKIQKWGVKNLLHKNHLARIAHIYMKAM
jgi:hypothetical protein